MKDHHPLLQVYAGQSSMARDGYSGPVQGLVTGGLRLAYEHDTTDPHRVVQRTSNGAYFWGGPAPSATDGNAVSGLTRFGFSGEHGYGYRLGDGDAELLFVTSNSALSWAVISPDTGTFPAGGTEAQRLRDFDSGLHFGEAWMPGVEVRFNKTIGLRLGYEWSQVYVRHMFWLWAGSQTIEEVVDLGVGVFVDEVAKSSPTLAPVVHFVLQNAVSAGFQYLRRNKMNWPFDTEAPLNIYTYRVGITLAF